MKGFLLHVLLPIGLLALAAGAAFWMWTNRTIVVQQPPAIVPPLVAVVVAEQQQVRLVVSSQGTAVPRTATTLAAEVAGRVVQVAPTLRNGAFFETGDELVRIEAVTYEAALRAAEAEVARADRAIAWERAEAAAAVAEWQRMHEGEQAPPLVSREPQLAEAAAVHRSALAAVEQARHDLERTVVRAPYDGRVLRAQVDTGDFVTRGAVLARVCALDAVEIELPVADTELPFLELPRRPGSNGGPAVRVFADFGGERREWNGRVVRTAGEIDPRTRMVHVIAEVEKPYEAATPLVSGMFVQAEIAGRELKDVVVLPRSALHDGDHVHVVERGDVLRMRPVDVLRRERERVVLRGGVAAGERVCTTSLEAPTDGMRVRVEQQPASAR